MRRLLSILLLAAFVLPVVAPGLSLAQDPDAALPACCRRHGEHHCSMARAERDPSAHYVTAVCAAWPQRAVAPSILVRPLAARRSATTLFSRTSFSPARESSLATLPTRRRAHRQRGPPAPPSIA